MVKVVCVNKSEITSKNGKKLYFLDLIDLDSFRVYKALTSAKHFDHIVCSDELRNFLDNEVFYYEGYINFNNGYTNFYLPKSEVDG